jgi:hypothetical protein
MAGLCSEAMEVALHRLRSAELVSWPWPAITHSDRQRLLQAVRVSIHLHTLKMFCMGWM